MKKNIGFLLSTVLCLCNSSTIGFAQTPANQPYPPQYGKPFKNVPDRRDVTMYQVNMRSFSKNGDLKGLPPG